MKDSDNVGVSCRMMASPKTCVVSIMEYVSVVGIGKLEVFQNK